MQISVRAHSQRGSLEAHRAEAERASAIHDGTITCDWEKTCYRTCFHASEPILSKFLFFCIKSEI